MQWWRGLPPLVQAVIVIAMVGFVLAAGHSLWTDVVSDWLK